MTPSPIAPPQSPPREGTGQAGWLSGTQEAPRLQRPGVGGLSPLPPPPSHPGAPPPHTLHPQGNLVLRAGALIFLGGGRREGQPLGDPLPGAPLKMVRTLPGQSHLPPAHRKPPPPTPAAVQLVPKHLKAQAGFGHTTLSPQPLTYSPSLGHLRMGRPPPTLGTALLLLWNSSSHLSIRPSVLVPS